MINPPIISSPNGTNSYSTKLSKGYLPEAAHIQQSRRSQSGARQAEKRQTEGRHGTAELQSPRATSPLKAKMPTDQASASASFSEILGVLSANATGTDGTPQISGQKDVRTVEEFSVQAQQTSETETAATRVDRRALAKKMGAKLDPQLSSFLDATSMKEQSMLNAPEIFIAPSATLEADMKNTAESSKATEPVDQNKLPVAANDTSSHADLLLAMLLLPPRDIKSPTPKEEDSGAANPAITSGMDSTQTRTKYDLAASYQQAVPNQPNEYNTPNLTIAHSPEAVNLITPSNKPSHTSLSTLDASPTITTAMTNVPIHNNLPDNQKIIATPLSSNNWADEFSQKINWMSMQQNYVAELYLNPPDLGALDVVLSVSGNQADALFTSPHSAVRDAVEHALPKLRELLAENGINLGSATVNDQPLRDRDPERFMRQNPNSTPGDGSTKDSKPDNLLPTDAKYISARRHLGMVDTFA